LASLPTSTTTTTTSKETTHLGVACARTEPPS
jgi:hypothetical protein